jgi:membrane-associated protein
MIPGFDLVQFTNTAGPIAAILVVTLIIFAESGLLIGFFLPGDSILFTLGFLLQSMGKIPFGLNINSVVLLLFVAAVAGDSVGYMTGRRLGPYLFNRPNSLLFKKENVVKAQKFYEKHGGKTILLARFVPIIRTFVPIVAGIGKMKYKTFITFNLIGGALWTGGVAYGGYFLGAWLTSLGIEIDTVLLPIVILILLASISPAIIHVLRNENRRQAIWGATKKQCARLFLRKK